MENLDLTETLKVATDIETASMDMVKRCSSYQDTTRALHRELEHMLQLHHREPDIFKSNPDLNRCILDFYNASALIAQDVEKMQVVGLDVAEQNLQRVRERLKHPENFEDQQMLGQIDTVLKSCKHQIQLARAYVNQLNTYVQYHARVLKTIKLD